MPARPRCRVQPVSRRTSTQRVPSEPRGAALVARLLVSLRRPSLCVLGVLLRPLPSVGGQQAPVFRAGVDLVNVGVTVTDQQGQPRHRPDRATTSRSSRTAGSRPSATSPPATRRRAGAGAAPRPAARRQRQHGRRHRASRARAAIKFLNTLTDADDITLVDFDTEVRVARYSQRDFARLDRADPPAEADGLDRALRRARHLSRRRRRAGRAARSCCSTPTAATRAARCASAS